jgi:hypothetical protein
MLGTWEVASVNGSPLSSLGEDAIPFRLLRIQPDGSLQLDTFVTEYEVLREEGETVTLSYSTIGREGTLCLRIRDNESADLTETLVDPISQLKSEQTLHIQRLP